MLDNIKQKLKDAPNWARDALKRAVIRTRRRSAAFRRAGGMRRAMDNLVDGVRKKQPRALITLGSAAAAVIAVAVIIISGGGKAAAQEEIASFLLPEDAVNIAAAMTPTPEATYAAPTPEPTPTPVSMGKGATGAQVKAVQERLMELGYTSREGNAFNTLTIRHILENPKYKGWYCGNKSQSVDYRTKRNILLDESEWVTYPDSSIPAIVPEELWNRANALYKRRREEMKSHSSGLSFHNRYPYSAKIYCEEHGTTFHRQVIQTKKGQQEVWQCKVYRSHGRAACSAPQIRSSDLDLILSDIFKELVRDKEKIIDSLVTVLTNIPKEVDYGKLRCQVENEMDDLERKKNRLLDLSIAGALTVEEFKERNDAFNVQILECQGKLTAIRQEEENRTSEELDIPAIRRALDEALRFTGEIDTALVATILDRVVVKKESTKDDIHLDIFLKLGSTYEAVYTPLKHTAGITSLKNTMHKPPTRRI